MSFSNPRIISGFGLVALLTAAGCTSSGLLHAEPQLRLATLMDDGAPPQQALSANLPLRSSTEDVVVKPAAVSSAPEADQAAQSAWCRYLSEDSAAQATIIRSPSLDGALDRKGKARLSVGLSASSFVKAKLIEEAAAVRCRKYLAERGLQKLIFLSPQGLTTAGYRAKFEAIQHAKAELEHLRADVAREMQAGNITVERATGLTVMIDQTIADGDAARSQAERRLNNGVSEAEAAKGLGRELLNAEADLAAINSRMRTADSVDVSVSAGWNDNDIGDGYDHNSDSFNGKVTFSVKLGAFTPQRYYHEREAAKAQQQAIRSEEGGLLWQVDTLRRAHLAAIDGLAASRTKLEQARKEADRLVSLMQGINNPDYAPALIGARIELLKLKANQAAIDGSITELKQNMSKLDAG